MARVWLVVLLMAGCSGAAASKKDDAKFGCVLAKFRENPSAQTICTQDCEAGNDEACTTLGIMYEQGHMVPERSKEQALTYVDRGCELGDPVGCFHAGEFRDATDDLTVRTSSYRKACEAKDRIMREDQQVACYQTASAFFAGSGVAADPDAAQFYGERACRLGSMDACEGHFAAPPEAAVARSNAPATELTFGEVDADGLKLVNMSCRLEGGGMMSGVLIVGLLSKRKDALDTCGATNDAQLSWASADGAMTAASADGNDDKINDCLAEVVRSVSGAPDGDCTATLPVE